MPLPLIYFVSTVLSVPQGMLMVDPRLSSPSAPALFHTRSGLPNDLDFLNTKSGKRTSLPDDLEIQADFLKSKIFSGKHTSQHEHAGDIKESLSLTKSHKTDTESLY